MFRVPNIYKDDAAAGVVGTPSAANIQGALHTSRFLGGESKKKKKVRKLVDAEPQKQTLYLMRPVTNGEEIIAWAKSQGFKTTLAADDLHVTIAFSREPVDWSQIGTSDEPQLNIVAGNDRQVLQFAQGATVLQIVSPELQRRWSSILNAGATWDWPDYKPHITISYDAEGVDLAEVRVFKGPIILGTERWSLVDGDWKADVVEKSLPEIEKQMLKPRKHPAPKDVGYPDSPRSREDDIAKTDDEIMGQVDLNKAGARHSKKDRDLLGQLLNIAVELGADPSDLKSDGDDEDDDDVDQDIGKYRIAKVDESLGLVFGYAVVCKVAGKDYYDLNIDPDGSRVPEHIPEHAMLKAATDFMENSSRAGNEMHNGPDVGQYVFAFPLTTDIAKAFGIQTSVTGLLVAFKPTAEVFAKYKSGEYTGFSIEGKRVSVREIED